MYRLIIDKFKLYIFLQEKVSVFINSSKATSTFDSTAGWVILSPTETKIKKKIEAIGVPLKDWDISIYRGILTGLNEAFIIDSKTKDKLMADSSKNAEIIRPILRGRDIRRYKVDKVQLYLLFIPWHFPLHKDPNIKGASQEAENAFKTEYPEIYEHLSNYKKGLSLRNQAETGIRYEWYALQRCANSYYEDFDKPKIIYPGLMRLAKSNETDFPRFYYDELDQYYFTNDTYFIVGKNLKYLTSLLNSRLSRFLLPYYIYSFDNTGFKIFTDYLDKMPFINISEEEQKPIIELVDLISNAKKCNQDTLSMENQIDNIIFNLYKLSEEEIEYIQGVS
jgi:adenine-specific DNA-methyltransferase